MCKLFQEFKELSKCEPNLCPVKDTPFILQPISNQYCGLFSTL